MSPTQERKDAIAAKEELALEAQWDDAQPIVNGFVVLDAALGGQEGEEVRGRISARSRRDLGAVPARSRRLISAIRRRCGGSTRMSSW